RSFPPTMLTETLPIVLLGHSSHPKRKGLIRCRQLCILRTERTTRAPELEGQSLCQYGISVVAYLPTIRVRNIASSDYLSQELGLKPQHLRQFLCCRPDRR